SAGRSRRARGGARGRRRGGSGRCQRVRGIRSAPSPLVGEGWGGGWCGDERPFPQTSTPTPNPSPQGGGEPIEYVGRAAARRRRERKCSRRDPQSPPPPTFSL